MFEKPNRSSFTFTFTTPPLSSLTPRVDSAVSLAALLSLDHRLMAEDTLVALDRMEGTVNDVRASPA